jgi:AraC family transcriptional regulator of adaptative response/methylated-DNA-[protein]-cysteine methyltransferase
MMASVAERRRRRTPDLAVKPVEGAASRNGVQPRPAFAAELVSVRQQDPECRSDGGRRCSFSNNEGAQAMNTPTPNIPVDTLRFGYGETGLGTVLVAESERGVAAIFLGEERDNLLRDLNAAFPYATLIPDEAGLSATIAKVAALVDAPNLGTDLRLDLRGSALELAVWEALRAIPPGETRTYGALAKALPMPAMAQEVGAACAANRLAVAVPCHRVVKADGSISGYRWGVQRKRRLINLEGVA